MRFTDLLVRIGAATSDDTYPVEALLEDGSVFFGGALHVDHDALRENWGDDAAYGRLLFEALFAGPLRRALNIANGRARSHTTARLRLRLWIDPDAAELHGLRWERIHQPGEGGEWLPLAASAWTPFSRYVGLEIPEPAPLRIRPLKVLIIVSNPAHLGASLAAVDVDAEVSNVRAALADFRQSSQMDVSIMAGRSGLSGELERQLRGEGYAILEGPSTLANIGRHIADHHIIFYIGHGAYRRRGSGRGHTAIFLEDEDGSAAPAVDTELVQHIQSLDPTPHLFFLVACQSALRELSDRNPFVGLAPRLIEAGVPAVVAMQDEVSMESARRLTHEFLRRLVEHGVVDQALNQARLDLVGAGRVDWAIPVLFSRLSTGMLFSADPVQEALVMIRRQRHLALPDGFHPLPIDVLHLPGSADLSSMEGVRQEAAATQDLVAAALNILAGRLRPEEERQRAPFVVLVGESGTAKSTKLHQIAFLSALPPDEPVEVPLLPLYVDLRRLPGNHRQGMIEELLYETLAELWPDLDRAGFEDLLRRGQRATLRVMFDGGDDLSEAMRQAAWRQIGDLVQQRDLHQYLLITDPDHYEPQLLKPTDILLIQPLAERKIKQYLEALPAARGRRLLRALERHQLFDLSAIPWLMGHLLRQARQDEYPVSRTAVLQRLLNEALLTVPVTRGMRARATGTLEAVALHMHRRRLTRLSIDEAFAVMAQVRGPREYTLEEMFDALVESGMLARVGGEQLRFVYGPVQSYCTARAIDAMPERSELIEDVAASLGRVSRLRWWEDALIYLSGLLDRPRELLHQLVYGVNLLASEQVFLAVRCVREAKENRVPEELVIQILDALIWRLDPRHESNDNQRIRAIHALAQLEHPDAFPYLLRLANRKGRVNRAGKEEFEPSHIRLAAVQALQRMMPRAGAFLRQEDDLLFQLLQAWLRHEAPDIFERVRSDDPAGVVLGAFMLAEWQPDGAFEALVAKFLAQEQESQVSWALAEALALFHPPRVNSQVILPLLEREHAENVGLEDEVWDRRATYYRVLAYLIGLIRSQEPRSRAFLAHCLYDQPNIWLKGKAIEALGWIYDVAYRDAFESVALGNFDGLDLPEDAAPAEYRYLQTKALAALAHIGDASTLTRLRKGRAGWDTELERAFYQASEEIYWRLNMSR